MREFAIQFLNDSFPTKLSLWYYKDNQWTRFCFLEHNTSNIVAIQGYEIPYGVSKIRITAHEYRNHEAYGIVQILWAEYNCPPDSYSLYLGGGSMYGDVNWANGTPKVLGNPLYHSGNGGHGSLMDADLLDGKHATDFASVYHHHVGTYEPVFAKNTAFNKNFATQNPASLGINTTAAPGTSSDVARIDHKHATPGYATPYGGGFMSKEDKAKLDFTPSGVATTTSNGFMSYGDKIKMNSLFKIICAGEVAANGDKGYNPIGNFKIEKIIKGRYRITTNNPGSTMVFVTGHGGYPAAVYGRASDGFYVITTNGTEMDTHDAPFSFMMVQF